MNDDGNLTKDGAEIIRPDFGAKRDPRERQTIRTARLEEDGGICTHEYVYISAHKRIVRCRNKSCLAELDPYDVLGRIARNWDNATWREMEKSRAVKAVESLKREEKRVKDRIRRTKPEQIGLPKLYCVKCRRPTLHDGPECLGCEGKQCVSATTT